MSHEILSWLFLFFNLSEFFLCTSLFPLIISSIFPTFLYILLLSTCLILNDIAVFSAFFIILFSLSFHFSPPHSQTQMDPPLLSFSFFCGYSPDIWMLRTRPVRNALIFWSSGHSYPNTYTQLIVGFKNIKISVLFLLTVNNALKQAKSSILIFSITLHERLYSICTHNLVYKTVLWKFRTVTELKFQDFTANKVFIELVVVSRLRKPSCNFMRVHWTRDPVD